MEQISQTPKIKYFVECKIKTYDFERLHETESLDQAIAYALQTYKHLPIHLQVVVTDNAGCQHMILNNFV